MVYTEELVPEFSGFAIESYYVPPLGQGVTIDAFSLKCDFDWNSVSSEITLTNHTGSTLVDQTLTRGRWRLSVGDKVFKAPGNDWQRDYFDNVFLYRPLDRHSIPSLPPGTYALRANVQYKAVQMSYGRVTVFVARGISEGTHGYIHINFRAVDYALDTVLVESDAWFEGVFSKQEVAWTPTGWRLPAEPDWE